MVCSPGRVEPNPWCQPRSIQVSCRRDNADLTQIDTASWYVLSISAIAYSISCFCVLHQSTVKHIHCQYVFSVSFGFGAIAGRAFAGCARGQSGSSGEGMDVLDAWLALVDQVLGSKCSGSTLCLVWIGLGFEPVVLVG